MNSQIQLFCKGEDTPMFNPKLFRVNGNDSITLQEFADINSELPDEHFARIGSLRLNEEVTLSLGAGGEYTIRRVH